MNFTRCSTLSWQRGVSLIELMIAMAIGLIMSAVVASLYMGLKGSFRYQEALSRLQENGRFALGSMARDARQAGFLDCNGVTKFANVVNDSTTTWYLNLSQGVGGYEGGVGVWPAEIPTHAATSDAVMFVGVDTAYQMAITGFAASAAASTFTTLPHSFQADEILYVSDCEQSSVFQMSGPPNAANTATTVVVAQGGTPGNCGVSLGANCGKPAKTHLFTKGSIIARLRGSLYYVDTASAANAAQGNSLYMLSTGSGLGAGTTRTELIPGVEDMQVEYGLDGNNDLVAENYVPASDVYNWGQVVSVKVSLLLRSADDRITEQPQVYFYKGASQTASDLRLRKVFTQIINLRNRTP